VHVDTAVGLTGSAIAARGTVEGSGHGRGKLIPARNLVRRSTALHGRRVGSTEELGGGRDYVVVQRQSLHRLPRTTHGEDVNRMHTLEMKGGGEIFYGFEKCDGGQRTEKQIEFDYDSSP